MSLFACGFSKGKHKWVLKLVHKSRLSLTTCVNHKFGCQYLESTIYLTIDEKLTVLYKTHEFYVLAHVIMQEARWVQSY